MRSESGEASLAAEFIVAAVIVHHDGLHVLGRGAREAPCAAVRHASGEASNVTKVVQELLLVHAASEMATVAS
jgi:hypothetical protein